MNKDNISLKQEIEELEMQILDMFEVIFHFANLDKKYLKNALDYYMILLDKDLDKCYNAESIIHIIEQIKINKPQWFITK